MTGQPQVLFKDKWDRFWSRQEGSYPVRDIRNVFIVMQNLRLQQGHPPLT